MNPLRETMNLVDEDDKYQFEVSAVYDQQYDQWLLDIKSWTEREELWIDIPYDSTDPMTFMVQIPSPEIRRKEWKLAIKNLSSDLTLFSLLFSVSVSDGKRTLLLDEIDVMLHLWLERDPRFAALVREHFDKL